MKKKNIMTAALSLSLVGVIAVGGTLAYFTDKSDLRTNVFVTGNVNISLIDKSDDPKAEEVEDEHGNFAGLQFTNVMPGDTLNKEVAVHVMSKELDGVAHDSSNAHVGILVMINENQNDHPSSEDLYKLVDDAVKRQEKEADSNLWSDPQHITFVRDDNLVDGVFYAYNPNAEGKGWEKGVPAGDTVPLFKDLEIPTSWGNEYASASFDIVVEAYAMQAENVSAGYLTSAVQGTFKDTEGNYVTFEQVADPVVTH